jgi:transcriptional regulator with XRE-family HTH domain
LIAEKIRMIRQQQGMSLQELADKSGVGKSSIFDAEQDGSNPTINTLLRLSLALKVPIEEFFKDEPSYHKKEVAQEVPVQEQQISKPKELEEIATKIIFMLYDKHISPTNAKKILRLCENLIELNSEIVINDGNMKVPFLSMLLK